MSVSAHTAAVMLCRKLLMNVAVRKGAGENLRFVEYVKYLCDNRLVPADVDDWVDEIRRKGNVATHEVAHVSREDSEQLLSFVEMLLKFVFEFPGRRQVTSLQQ